MGRYEDVFARSIEAPEEFWGRAAERITWTKRWDRVLDDSNPPFYRWFAGGGLNTCHNCLDRHVELGRADVLALIYDSPVTHSIEKFTYRELLDRVAVFAGALLYLGVRKGDTVIIYMPMIPETVVAMLACARIGVVHSVVFGGFAPHELAIRIDDARSKLLLTASGAIEGAKLLGGRRPSRRLRVGEGHRPPLHPLHLRDHGEAEGGGARQRRPRPWALRTRGPSGE